MWHVPLLGLYQLNFYTYEQGNLKYINTYVGSERFSGEEGIWVDNIPYWTMNYFYHCHINGDFSWLQGYEEIFYEHTKIYECHLHGGIIMP